MDANYAEQELARLTKIRRRFVAIEKLAKAYPQMEILYDCDTLAETVILHEHAVHLRYPYSSYLLLTDSNVLQDVLEEFGSFCFAHGYAGLTLTDYTFGVDDDYAEELYCSLNGSNDYVEVPQRADDVY